MRKKCNNYSSEQRTFCQYVILFLYCPFYQIYFRTLEFLNIASLCIQYINVLVLFFIQIHRNTEPFLPKKKLSGRLIEKSERRKTILAARHQEPRETTWHAPSRSWPRPLLHLFLSFGRSDLGRVKRQKSSFVVLCCRLAPILFNGDW